MGIYGIENISSRFKNASVALLFLAAYAIGSIAPLISVSKVAAAPTADETSSCQKANEGRGSDVVTSETQTSATENVQSVGESPSPESLPQYKTGDNCEPQESQDNATGQDAGSPEIAQPSATDTVGLLGGHVNQLDDHGCEWGCGGSGTNNITIKKDAIPDSSTQAFQFITTGGGLGNFSLVDGTSSTNTKEFSKLKAGTYTITETDTPGWSFDNVSCSGRGVKKDGPKVTITFDRDSSESRVTCTYTNRQHGKITVYKVTQPANDPTGFQVTASGSGTVFGDKTQTVKSGQPVVFEVDQDGKYSVSEAAAEGWTQTSNTCKDIKIDSRNLTKTCTITNKKDAVPGKLVIAKITNPASTQMFDFTSPDEAIGDFSLTGSGEGSSKVFTLKAGSYTVAEKETPGWDLTDMSCNTEDYTQAGSQLTVRIGDDQTVTCWFTNTKSTGTLTVVKRAVPQDSQVFDFTLTPVCRGEYMVGAGGNQIQGKSIGIERLTSGREESDCPASTNFQLQDAVSGATKPTQKDFSLAPGEYIVGEVAANGWDSSVLGCGDNDGWYIDEGTGQLTVRIVPGSHMTCTFINTKRAQVTITKDAQPNSTQAFVFTTNLGGGEGKSEFSLVDDGSGGSAASRTFSDVLPGKYTVSESTTLGWTLKDITCTGAEMTRSGGMITLVVAHGDVINCTFTNQQNTIPQVLGEGTTTGPKLENTGTSPIIAIVMSLMVIALATTTAFGSFSYIKQDNWYIVRSR